MTRQAIEVELAGYRSLARGYGSRDLIESVTGRAPVWFRAERAWAVTERVARDVIAAAESKGMHVVVIGPRQASMSGIGREDRIVSNERPDPGRGLW